MNFKALEHDSNLKSDNDEAGGDDDDDDDVITRTGIVLNTMARARKARRHIIHGAGEIKDNERGALRLSPRSF
jgi:hypothetical protein